jgi:hypothetical protein
MDAILGLLNNTFFKAIYDPAVSALKDTYNANFKSTVDSIAASVFGPMETRLAELRNTNGVSAQTINKMEDLIYNIKERLKDPGTITLDRLKDDWALLQTEFSTLEAQAKSEAAAFARQQATEAEAQVTQAEEDKTFNFYRLLERIKQTALKYIFVLIVFAIALFGGSLMSNRAVTQTLLFRIYYFVYGTLLFPLSYFVIITDFTVNGKLPHMYAILAPIFESKNHMVTVRTLLFPFMYTKPVVLT